MVEMVGMDYQDLEDYIVGHLGPKGDTGVPGPKGDGAGGVVYVRWGHNSCPDGGAQLVYAGRAAWRITL